VDQDPYSYFTRVEGNRYGPTVHTGGAWSVSEQHISPLIGLLVHAVERALPTADKAISRIGVDILGVIGMDEFEVHTRVLRPGRTVELVESTATAHGRSVAVARIWRLSTSDTTAVAGGTGPPLPPPENLPSWPIADRWPGGYITGIDMRPVVDPTPGHVTTWLSTPITLVDGEPVSPLARLIGLVDTANGIAVRVPPTEWAFPNLDLTIHLFREPQGDWLGLDTSVVFSADGRGLTTSTLHDLSGPIGRAEQILTLRPRTD